MKNLCRCSGYAQSNEFTAHEFCLADDAILHQGNGLTFTNSLGRLLSRGPTSAFMSATADCYLNGYNDPRLGEILCKEYSKVCIAVPAMALSTPRPLTQTKVSAVISARTATSLG